MPKLLAILFTLLIIPFNTLGFTAYCTAYTPYEQDGIMANGLYVQEGYVACDFLPLGTAVWINGIRYIVGDRIGDGSDNHIDIVMNSYDEAIYFGVQYLECEVE